MPRNVDSALLTALSAPHAEIVHLVALNFFSGPRYIWSGVGTLAWNGAEFSGVGSMGALGDVKEGTEVRADGSGVQLSGIDPIYLGEAMTDIWLGGPAMRWMGAVIPGTKTLIGTPYPVFAGQVDKPTIHTAPDTVTIQLALETRMVNHARSSNRRYTSADQAANGYPDDTSMRWVPVLADIALGWGT